jgi:hypothetical protein
MKASPIPFAGPETAAAQAGARASIRPHAVAA